MSISVFDIEEAITDEFNGLFPPRRYIVVPNVSWGMWSGHECDLLALSGSGYATEIEIKISRSDLQRDFKKRHRIIGGSKMITSLFYAGSEAMRRHFLELCPDDTGIIIVSYIGKNILHAEVIKPAHRRKDAVKWGDKERIQLSRLGVLRYWNWRKRKRPKELDRED